jgi:tRNA A-37 threonylcarbamoyl transferase component Bud32
MNTNILFYIKKDVNEYEYKITKMLSKLYSFIPDVISYDETKCEMTIQKIDNLCISDMYGENFMDVPESIRENIKEIISTLYNDGICYPDITGYNFIEDNNGKIWIIDFEHCFWRHIKFVKAFISSNVQTWNPYFL